ncbi:MAG: MFS transporter [Anaerolineae bacterium]|nr:MFS transporter [Anaerolineae bacterium]
MRNLWYDIGRDTRWVMAAYVLWGIGEGMWLFIEPLYVKSLGATPAQTGFVIGMWGLGRLLFILPAGILADRWGPHRLLIPGWYIGVLGVLIMAVAPDWRWAAPGFLVYGISASAIPATNLYLAQGVRYDPTRRPDLPLQSTLTLLWAAYSIGLVVSPGIGGLIGDAVGLRTVFLLSLFWFGLSTAAIRRTRPYPKQDRPPLGYDYRGLLSRWPVFVAFVVITLGFMAVLIGQPLAPQYLEEVRGFSGGLVGAFGSINALGTAAGSILLGRLPAWRGFLACLLLVLLAFGLLLLTGNVFVVIVAYFILGAHYATRPLAVSVISAYVAEHQRGMAYALVDTLAGLATLVGTNLAGVLYDRNPDWPFMVGMTGIVSVVALGIVMLRQRVSRYREVVSTYTGLD